MPESLRSRLIRLPERATAQRWRDAVPADHEVGFVPTMGALHEGHGALVRRAAAECPQVLVSIFVNPLQFNQASDFERYPRALDEDCRLLEEWGGHAVYCPTPEDVYPEEHPALLQPGPGGQGFEGEHRPGHFAGVLTVVDRLFQQLRPSRAYFGEKDAQQLFLVREMARQRGLPVEIVACATVRESDGLALSSRNRLLSAEDRARALVLHRALLAARDAFEGGLRDVARLEAAMLDVYRRAALAPEYASVVDDRSFLAARDEDRGPWRAVTAAVVGSTRLIDNLFLGHA